MFKTVLWATDGSESADRALPYAKELVARDHGTLIVVHCIETFAAHHAAGLPVHPDEDELKAKVNRQVEQLSSEGIDVRAEVHATHAPGAAHLITDVAREANADAIVVGTRGHTALAGLLVGSVTHRLLHIAPCPVMAVPSISTGADREHSQVAQATA